MAEQKALALINGKISEVPAGDTIRGASASGGIPQLAADPVAPIAESSWVRSTQVSTAGSPIGLLLSLTQAVNTYTYELRYRTQQGITVGVPLS